MSSPSIARIVRAAACPFAITAAVAALCCVASGASLGLYFGSIAMTALLVPPIASSKSSIVETVSIIDGVGIVWFVAVLTSSATFGQWLACYLILIAFVFAMFALSRAIVAPAVTMLALAWLSWPVWMSVWVTGRIASWLTPAHPLLAINRVMPDLGVWTQERLMYQFTSLGQDVPYALPGSIWPCVLLHLAIGLIPLLLAGRPLVAWRVRSSVHVRSV